MLPNDYCRCHERDNTCPSKAVCQRYTTIPEPEVAQEIGRIKRVVAELYDIAGDAA